MLLTIIQQDIFLFIWPTKTVKVDLFVQLDFSQMFYWSEANWLWIISMSVAMELGAQFITGKDWTQSMLLSL